MTFGVDLGVVLNDKGPFFWATEASNSLKKLSASSSSTLRLSLMNWDLG